MEKWTLGSTFHSGGGGLVALMLPECFVVVVRGLETLICDGGCYEEL